MDTKRSTIIVRLPKHLAEIVKARAATEHRSRSNFVGMIIADWIAAQTAVAPATPAAAGGPLKKRAGEG